MRRGKQQRQQSPAVSKSSANTAPSTPMLDGTPKPAAKEPIKVDTNVRSSVMDPLPLDRLSPSVRDVAQHAAMLKSVMSLLTPICDMVEREASRMVEVSPFLAGKDQVVEARNRLTAEAQQREEKIRVIKDMIEGEKQKFVATVNERLEKMIKDVVVNKVKEKVKEQVAEIILPYRKLLKGSGGRTMRNQMFLNNIEAKNQNATIRSRFPQERITPIHRISVEFPIQPSPTSSPNISPVGGYHPSLSPSPKFPATFAALIKLSLPDSLALLKDYALEANASTKDIPEEARLDNLNKLMVHFGIGYRLHPGPAKKGPIITSLWDRR